METVQINTPRFSYQTAAPVAPRTLNDMRINPDHQDTQGGSYAVKSMKPAVFAALIVAAIAGAAIGIHRYSENTTENSAAAVADPSVPAASMVPATSNTPVAPAAPTAKDSPTTNPMTPMTKAEESNSMPFAGQANNHSSESLNPVKAREAAKPAARTRTVQPNAAPAAAMQSAPAAREAASPTQPAPVVIEEKPVVPQPAPISEPAPTSPPEPPKL